MFPIAKTNQSKTNNAVLNSTALNGAAMNDSTLDSSTLDGSTLDNSTLDSSTAKSIVKRKRNRPDLKNFGAENVEAGDNSRFLRHAMAGLDLPPIDISDDRQVSERLDWYFNHCIEDDMKPTVTGMANCLGIDKTTLWSWRTGECRASTHSPLIKKAYKLLEELWEGYMLSGKVNPASGIFLGRNHWGYQDKIDVVVTPNTKSDTDYSEEDLRKLYGASDSDPVSTTFSDEPPTDF